MGGALREQIYIFSLNFDWFIGNSIFNIYFIWIFPGKSICVGQSRQG